MTDIPQALRARRLEYKERMMLKKQVKEEKSNKLGKNEIEYKSFTFRLQAQERTTM